MKNIHTKLENNTSIKKSNNEDELMKMASNLKKRVLLRLCKGKIKIRINKNEITICYSLITILAIILPRNA